MKKTKLIRGVGLKKPTETFSSLGEKKQGAVVTFAFGTVMFCIAGFMEPVMFVMSLLSLAICGFLLYYFLRGIPAKQAEALRNVNIERELEEKKLAYMKEPQRYYFLNEKDVAAHEASIDRVMTLGAIINSSVYQEKEHNWALIGGSVAGVAGQAAGVAAATQAILDNQRIKAENKKRREWGREQQMTMTKLAMDNINKGPKSISLEKIEKMYDIDYSWSPETLLKKLKFKDKATISQFEKSRSVEIETQWKTSNHFNGSIRAKLYNPQKECVGCAYLSFPKDGTKGGEGVLKGMIAVPKTEGPYTVEFEPIDLWGFYSKGDKPTQSDGLTKEQHDEIVKKYEESYQKEIM